MNTKNTDRFPLIFNQPLTLCYQVIACLLMTTTLHAEKSTLINQYNDSLLQLEKTEKNIIKTSQTFDELSEKIEKQIQQTQDQQIEKGELSERINQHKKLIALQLKQLQKIQNQPIIKRLLQPEHYSQTVRHSHYLRELPKAHISTIAILRRLDKQLSNNISDNKTTFSALQKNHQALSEKITQLQKQKSNRQYEMNSLEQALSQEEVSRYALRDREEKYQLALKTTHRKKNQNTIEKFNKLKGKIEWPSAGLFKPLKGVYHKAWQVSHNQPTPVYAIASGIVVGEVWLPQLGMVIIIDHGDGYRSVYGNNSQIMTKQDDLIEENQIIAYSGNSGGRQDIGLFFQLWHHDKPTDLNEWLSNGA